MEPGQSGNPRGQPFGAKRHARALTEQMTRELLDAGPEVLRAVIKQARDGDVVSQKMILDRAYPVRRAASVLDLTADGRDFDGDFAEASTTMFRQMGRGETASGDVAEAVRAMSHASKAIMFVEAIRDVTGRVALIEQGYEELRHAARAH
jgi:hypothetical protein